MSEKPIPQISADEKFTEMVTRQQLVNPFDAERSALKSRAPGQLLSHETVRLSRLDSFNSLFRQAAPIYHAAIKTGNFNAAAHVANSIAVAAKAVGTMVLLLALLAGAARAQSTLPASTKDPGASENLDYLAQQVKKLQSASATGGTAGTLGGTNAWTGSNTFTGVVHISSGASVTFLSTLGFTSSQTSFTPAASVTGSTISFTVAGTTVACWTSGKVTMAAGDQVSVGIGVDGSVSKIPGTSSAVGVGGAYSSGANIRQNITTYTEFQVSAGASHTFWMGLWTGGAGLTFPDTTSIGQFGCREVPSR